jgi:hypothetical protein
MRYNHTDVDSHTDGVTAGLRFTIITSTATTNTIITTATLSTTTTTTTTSTSGLFDRTSE